MRNDAYACENGAKMELMRAKVTHLPCRLMRAKVRVAMFPRRGLMRAKVRYSQLEAYACER